jgi:hypothetical protein
MSDTTQIPSEERPFVLRFHGFVEDCPHAVQRFTNFCTADLNLSAEETGRILEAPGSAVICKKDSRQDLSSLVDALEELGVRVSIADLCDAPSRINTSPVNELAEISPQLEELLRAPSLRVIQASCSPGEYVLALDNPTEIRKLGNTSYGRIPMYNQDREQQGTRTMRDLPPHHHGAKSHPLAPGMRHRRTRTIRPRTYGRRQTGLTGIQMIGMLLAGLACLLGVNRAFMGKPDLSHEASNYKFGTSWGIPTPPEQEAAASTAGYRHYDGTVSRNGYVLTISSRMHEEALSARVLIVTPRDTPGRAEQSSTPPQLRRAESDTTLLHESEPGIWTGRLVTYLFIEQDGQMRRVPAQTEITLEMTQDQRTAQARVVLDGTIPRAVQNLDEIPGTVRVTTDEGLSLQLEDRVTLRAASVSF